MAGALGRLEPGLSVAVGRFTALGACCDPGVARLDRAASDLQGSDPAAHWSRADRRLVDEAAVVPLSSRKAAYVTSKRVGNYQYHLAFGVLLDQLWVKGS